jgi:recombinational DNA repair ATPase RecF
MKVLELVAHNVMGIKDVQFDLEGHNLFLIGGKNGQGKTSAIKALLMALCGRSGMSDYPEVALREGEDSGFVTVKLSGSQELHDDKGFTVRLHMKRKVGGGVSEEFEVLDRRPSSQPKGSPKESL